MPCPHSRDITGDTATPSATRSYRWQGSVLVGYTLATGERYAATYDEYSPAGCVTRSR